jgi:hypothetical protein
MSNKQKDNTPNSLIIYIKTRIPNFYKSTYEPYMTVPKSKSHTVYLDPLIKYYERPINNIPKNAPKDTLYSQFFEATEFDTMINRILSTYMQKSYTLEEAYDKQLIDNNIQITLNTLFKNNNIFYINNKPYTIVGSNWNAADWKIAKKPFDKLISQFSYLTPEQLKNQIKEEEKDIPESIRQGNLASANLVQEQNTNKVTNDLQNAANSTVSITQMQNLDPFIERNELPGVPQYLKRLCSELLKKNSPINYSDIPDISRDPITLSLLIDPTELLKYINTYKDDKIIETYTVFINAKTALQNADQEYYSIFKELTNYKTEVDNSFKAIIDSNKLNNAEKQEFNLTIQEINLLKINYFKLIFKLADIIMQIYTLQKTYFISTKLLLEELKIKYVNIIKYYEEPLLAIKCIDYDISTLQSLIEEDPENAYSKTYFSDYNTFNNFYEQTLYKNKEILLNPQLNYAEEIKKYKDNLDTLKIEMQQYEIYNFKMFLFYSYNQFNIWITLFKSIQEFTNVISNIAQTIVVHGQQQIDNYDSKFSKDKQETFLNTFKVAGVKASYNNVDKKLTWYLVKEDGTKCLNKNIDKFTEDDIMQEKLYISTIQNQVKSYDAIILYIYLLEINCLRRNRLYVAEQNVEYLNYECSLTLNNYYNIIEENLNLNPNTFIPGSLLWTTTDFNDVSILDKRTISNKKLSIIYRKRIKILRKSKDNLEKRCENIEDIITPTISENGFIEKCKTLIQNNDNYISENSFRSSYWLEKTIQDYDIVATNDFIYNIERVVKDAWYDRMIDTTEPDDYLDWVVYNNSATNTDDSIYASICDALNGQMDLDGAETENKYTELINGKKIFTINSLKQLVAEMNRHSSDNQIDNILITLQEVLKIKFIIFDMEPRIEDKFYVIDIVKFQGRKYRIIGHNSDNDKLMTLYDGNSIIKDIPYDELEKTDSNLFYFFNIVCMELNSSINFEDYIYLVTSRKNNANSSTLFAKFELVRNSSINNYIFNFNSIPRYINYLLYNNCARLFDSSGQVILKDITNAGLKDFYDIFNEFTEIINKQILLKNAPEELETIDKQLENALYTYEDLIGKPDKTNDEKFQLTILEEDIKELREKKAQLESFLYVGGEKHSNQLNADYPNLLRYPSSFYDETFIYNKKGGDQNSDKLMNVKREPDKIVINLSKRQPVKQVPYNVSQNKEKDTKSKFSFYVTVELELFPGKTANIFQKSVVKCQSNFERMREAYAEIFGLQYRPSPMVSAFAYKKNKTSKKKTSNKNKTSKNKQNENKSEDNKIP